jgi:hypothetical protein
MYSREANQSLRKFKPRFTSNQQVKRQLSLIQVVVLITVRQNVFYLQTRQAWQSYRLGHLFRSNWGQGYSYSFVIRYNEEFLANLVGPLNFIDSQIVFIGKDIDKLQWAIADP